MSAAQPRRAIVTGGSRGIGRAIVGALAEAGYEVHFTFRTSPDQARSLEAEQPPGRCRGGAVDGADPAAVAAFVAQVEREGPVSLLVNNAGMAQSAIIDQVDAADLRVVLDNNLGGVFNFCKAVVPGMRRARFGDIVNISSLASRNVRVGNSLYGAAKVAVERFSETLAVECARSNIAVNVIAPGFVETEMTAEHLDDKTRRDLLSRIPLRRFTASREIAEAVLMLVTRKPLLIGAVVPVGGGGHLMS